MLAWPMAVIKSKKIEILSIVVQNTERTGCSGEDVESGYFYRRLD